MNPSTKPSPQVPMERWEVFLRVLADRVSVANEGNLTARCWKPSTLSREIKALTKSHQQVLRSTFPPAHAVIEQLKRMGWIHPVKVQAPPGGEEIEFLLLGRDAGQGESMDPLELLQAFLPDGVICYFSAISYYELTTQVATHHHIARLGPAKPPKTLEPAAMAEPGPKATTMERNPLGTAIFRFQDVDFYLTRRDASLVPGMQMRVVGPSCWLRLTTMEQTLLDGLMQPVRCGGEAVVLEAWEKGVPQLDADRMAEHLGQIQRDDLDRRVGAMLEMLGWNFPKSDLARHLNPARERMKTQDGPDIPLLAGLAFSGRNNTWKVQTP